MLFWPRNHKIRRRRRIRARTEAYSATVRTRVKGKRSWSGGTGTTKLLHAIDVVQPKLSGVQDRIRAVRRFAPSPATSQRMRLVRTRDTSPEQSLRTAMDQLRLSYRSQFQTLAGCVDFAFPRRRVAVFVDGEFWHGRSWKRRGFDSLQNQFDHWRNGRWWLEKVRSNIARDRRQTRLLRRAGWSVLRVTDAAIRADADRCARRIGTALARRS
jgi:DNA mismatch endonuclease, patch repair protein